MLKYFIFFLFLPILVFSQDMSDCKMNNEIVPKWICNSDSTTKAVGIGDSYNQSISLALCEISNKNFLKISKLKYKKGTMALSQTSIGDNILVAALFKDFILSDNTKIKTYVCKVFIKNKDVSADVHFKETVDSITNNSEYNISKNVKFDEVLIDNGIKIEKVYIGKKSNKFYVLVSINNLKIKEYTHK